MKTKAAVQPPATATTGFPWELSAAPVWSGCLGYRIPNHHLYRDRR